MTDMRISDDGLEAIFSEESFIDHVYPDQLGKPTIGIGHLVQPGEKFPDRITREEGLALFRRDLASREAAVNRMVRVPLTQAQFDALVSLVFNIGEGGPSTDQGFYKSTVRRLLNAGDYEGAASHFADFCKGGGKVLPVLVLRRERERRMFLGLPDLTSTRGVQQALADLGYLPASGVDGVNGPQTLAAIKAFQKRAGLLADGEVGPKTRFQIQAALDQKSLHDVT